MEKFQQKYRIPSARLKGHDYGSNGLYFVTICTHQRIHYFGKIVETRDCASKNTGNVETHNRASLRATPMGLIAHQFWTEIPQHYPFVVLDEFVVMPNHIHGILFFNRPDKIDWTENKFGSQSRNLAAVIRGFKASVKRYANENNLEFAWQSRFHDSIIKNEEALRNIQEYIVKNPINWHWDKLNAQNSLNTTAETHDNNEMHNRASLPQTNL